jgi:hypothetical protein
MNLDIRLIYLRNKDIYCIFKICYIIFVFFGPQTAFYVNILLFFLFK